MTVFYCQGFEALGDTSAAGADVETLINATNGEDWVLVSGGHAADVVSIIDDFETVGYALEWPTLQSARAEYFRVQNPDGTGRFADYQVSTNASAPVFCVGFRFYNADWTSGGSLVNTIFQVLNGATSGAASLQVLADKETLRLIDNDGLTYDASSTLSLSTWHYIEVEWKQTTIANGGYCKVYLDGNVVIDESSIDMAGFTFFSTYGFRIGVGTSGGNQSGGENYAFDDVYAMVIDGVEHTAPLGACRVYAMRPTSDATPNDWTPSTGGDNFALVDEDTQDETDYVDATATGNDDHYGLSGLENTSDVHALRIDVSCVAVDGTPTLHLGFDDGTADEQSMGTIATGSTQNRQQTFETDPSGAAWTEASAESVEATQRMTE